MYFNAEHEFFAVSRFDDVQRGLVDRETFSSARGSVLEFIKANIQMPPGVVIFEDPPVHTAHRGLLSRVFTPKKMDALEPKVRDFCARALDPLVGAGHFDFVADLGAEMPMRTIGMLLGIPEEGLQEARNRADAALRTEPGKPMEVDEANIGQGDFFGEYIDWRADHPSDDLMTELLFAELEDETGTTRRLTRDEVLLYVSVLSGAGNETTNRLIGWTGKVLAEHPDQRRELVADRSLVPNAIEELLRFEPPDAPRRPLRHPGRRAARHDRSGGERPAVPERVRQPRRRARTRTPIASTSTARSVSTSPSGTGSTTASGPPSPGSRGGWPSTRSCSASPSGRSTGTTPAEPRRRPSAAGTRCRW